MRLVSTSPSETERIAARLAKVLRAGDIVTVAGEIGAGKTTFVRGACRALGVEEPVASPTFMVGRRYHGSDVDVSHLDLYRFAGVSSAEWGDLEPYFEHAITFVEWPEAAGTALGDVRVAALLRHEAETVRLIELDSAQSLLDQLQSE